MERSIVHTVWARYHPHLSRNYKVPWAILWDRGALVTPQVPLLRWPMLHLLTQASGSELCHGGVWRGRGSYAYRTVSTSGRWRGRVSPPHTLGATLPVLQRCNCRHSRSNSSCAWLRCVHNPLWRCNCPVQHLECDATTKINKQKRTGRVPDCPSIIDWAASAKLLTAAPPDGGVLGADAESQASLKLSPESDKRPH